MTGRKNKWSFQYGNFWPLHMIIGLLKKMLREDTPFWILRDTRELTQCFESFQHIQNNESILKYLEGLKRQLLSKKFLYLCLFCKLLWRKWPENDITMTINKTIDLALGNHFYCYKMISLQTSKYVIIIDCKNNKTKPEMTWRLKKIQKSFFRNWLLNSMNKIIAMKWYQSNNSWL